MQPAPTKDITLKEPSASGDSFSDFAFPRKWGKYFQIGLVTLASGLFAMGCKRTEAEWIDHAKDLPKVTPAQIIQQPNYYEGDEVLIVGSPELRADYSRIHHEPRRYKRPAAIL